MRIQTEDFNRITKHLASSGEDESFLYCLFTRTVNPASIIYLCRQILLPDKNDLENQTAVSIEPGQQYKATAYGLAYDLKTNIVDFHTHPFTRHARFSSIDDHYGAENAAYIAANFPDSTTMGMVVLGKGFDNFDAQVWNKETACFEKVTRLEILGVPTTLLVNQENEPRIKSQNDPYARHRIIPGWRQGLLESLKVFVCGLGGNGSLILESLLALGVGKNGGWIKACDPDILEASNLPRIPYAYPRQIGKPKASIAKAYAHRKAPDLNVACYQEGIESPAMQAHLKEANLIIGCIDNDGGRLILNSHAARYMIPYIDIGTEIVPGKDQYESIGQVQLFIPGKTGCLMCSGAINLTQAALDSMSKKSRAEHARIGYVRGSQDTPTPSVLHLNGVVSHLAISQMLRFLFDDHFNGKDFLHYNRQDAAVLAAASPKNDDCPVCGIQGYLGAGDEDASILDELSDLKNNKAFAVSTKSSVQETILTGKINNEVYTK